MKWKNGMVIIMVSPLPQGLYLWFLKVTTPSRKSLSKTGRVTIVRNR